MKRLIKYLIAIVLFGEAVLAWVTCNPKPLVYRLAYHSPNVLYFAKTKEKIIALTIDDSPHSVVTPKILDVLAEHQVPATFFLIGERVASNEEIVRQIVSEGHEIGNHHMQDRPSIKLSEAEFERQLLEADEILSDFAQVKWFRPASAWFNQRMLRQLEKYNYKCALGSVYPYDAAIHNVTFLSNYILDNVFPGAIIILHDGTLERKVTVDVLKQIIPKLKSHGYRFVTLTELTKSMTIVIYGPIHTGVGGMKLNFQKEVDFSVRIMITGLLMRISEDISR